MACAASFSLLAACGDWQPELGPGDVRTLRVLGVKSEPADPVPGQPAKLSALVMNATPDELGMVWVAVDPQSVLASEGAGPGAFDASRVAFAGLVTPPVVFPRMTTPAYPLLATAAYVPAVTFGTGVTSAAVIVLAHAGKVDFAKALGKETQDAYLRQLAAESVPAVKILRMNDPLPNANPAITSVKPLRYVTKLNDQTNRAEKARRLDVWDIPRGGRIEMKATVEDESPLCESDDRKDYGKRGVSCVSFSWYAANGRMHGFVRSLEIWEAPRLPGIYTLAVVVRDRVGGLDWHLQDINVGRSVEPGKIGRVLLRSDTVEDGVTRASRLLWLPVDDSGVMAELEARAGAGAIFAAGMSVRPTRAGRLSLAVEEGTFVLADVDAASVSLQAAAERELAGAVNLRFTAEVAERRTVDE